MKKIFFYALGLMCALSAQASVTTYAYDGDKSEEENGTALQAAINAAEESGIDTLKVQAGMYYGNFTMKKGVNVIGGWNEGFTSKTDYATILDAQANGRVVNQEADFATMTIWENLTIQNGKLTAELADKGGAGVWLRKKGQVKHCEIRNNTFSHNGTCMGGGVGNNAVDANTDVCVDDCWVHNNKASHGGGVRIRGTVQNSLIENDTTELNAGGGVHLQGGRIVGCIVRGNTGKATGGVRAFGKCDVINNLIYNNTATQNVGGLGIESALSNVIGNTIVKNKQLGATGPQAGVRINHSDKSPLNPNGTFFVNNVVWGNMSSETAETQNVHYISRYDEANRGYNALTHQNTTNGIKLSMNNDENDTYIDSDSNEQTGRAPHFADPANGDYRLTWQSPMLGRANSSSAVVTKDLDGNNRNIEGVDLGAYELPYYTLTIAAFDHATLTIGEDAYTAGAYSVPKGYTATATIAPAEGYSIKSVKIDEDELEAVAGVYTLPAVSANVTLTIEIQQDKGTAIDNTKANTKAAKQIRNGQLLILRDGKEFNVLGSQL